MSGERLGSEGDPGHISEASLRVLSRERVGLARPQTGSCGSVLQSCTGAGGSSPLVARPWTWQGEEAVSIQGGAASQVLPPQKSPLREVGEWVSSEN